MIPTKLRINLLEWWQRYTFQPKERCFYGHLKILTLFFFILSFYDRNASLLIFRSTILMQVQAFDKIPKVQRQSLPKVQCKSLQILEQFAWCWGYFWDVGKKAPIFTNPFHSMFSCSKVNNLYWFSSWLRG